MKTFYFSFLIPVLVALILSSCEGQGGQAAKPEPELSQPSVTLLVPSATATITPNPTPSSTATPTPQPFYITATVWSSDPIVPALAYHRFQGGGISGATTVRLDDFRAELESLYQSGYTLVPLGRWLAGDLRLPAGRRPLIFTMDDLFYRNQIRFNADGTIDPMTGLGASYEFSQSHPDFGFSWALFSNLGDKPYIDEKNPLILANAIVWCIDHGALVYNHTYTHARLSQTSYTGITWELSANDKRLNQLLTLAGRPDLIAKLGNILALPFGEWPRDPAGENALIHYRNPSGLEMQAVMNIDYIYRPRYMLPPYSPNFHRMDVPRIVATVSAVDYFTKNAAKVPAAQTCKLGPLDQTRSSDATYLADQINQAIQNGSCPPGIYATDKFVFRAQEAAVELIFTVRDQP
ncbi:MAG: hypothetical protein M1485_01395 [Chloroflexi bacterium]|nr:hypothetical protein [Chloroflexota bacterium]